MTNYVADFQPKIFHKGTSRHKNKSQDAASNTQNKWQYSIFKMKFSSLTTDIMFDK